jgi:hypothetical protein
MHEAETPWRIEHLGHFAWFQRSFLAGDFAPGKIPLGNYVIVNGRAMDPGETPVCGTCGEVPRVEDLEPVDHATEDRGFLDRFRRGLVPWKRAGRTDPSTCWWCNFPGPLVVDQGPVKLCAGCAAHLKEY